MNTKKAQDRKAKSAKEDSNTLKSTVLQMHSTVAIV